MTALRNVLILRKPPTGPAFGRPEDRLHGCLEGRVALIQPLANSFAASEEASPAPTLENPRSAFPMSGINFPVRPDLILCSLA